MISTSPASPSERAVEAAYASAVARWPGLTIGPSAVAERLSALQLAPGQLESHLATRGAEMIIAVAAAAADAVAIGVVDREFLTPARTVMQRYTRDGAQADELVQQLRIHMLVATGDDAPRIARFDGRAALGAWISMCATRLALSAHRSSRASREVSVEWSDALADLPAADPVVESLRARHAARVAEALRIACESLSRRHRAIVRLLFIDGASVDEAAAMYGVHRVTIWRQVQEAREELGAGIRAQLGADSSIDHGAASLVEG